MDYLMRCQNTVDLRVRGANMRTQLIWGKYPPLTFPNWPAQFFIDAILMRYRAL